MFRRKRRGQSAWEETTPLPKIQYRAYPQSGQIPAPYQLPQPKPVDKMPITPPPSLSCHCRCHCHD